MSQIIMRQVPEMRVQGNLSHCLDPRCSARQPLPLVTITHLKLKHTAGAKHIKDSA